MQLVDNATIKHAPGGSLAWASSGVEAAQEWRIGLADLVIKRLDRDEAAANVEAVVRREIPAATNLRVVVEGDPRPRSIVQGSLAEISASLGERRGVVIRVTLDADTPRPIRVRCDFLPVGRGAAVATVMSVVRLRRVIPGGAHYRRVRFRTSALVADGRLRELLAGAPDLDGKVGRFLRGAVVLGGSTALTIEPYVHLSPDPDGAFLVSYDTPGTKRLGLGGRFLNLDGFLAIAVAIEQATVNLPDSWSAPFPAVALPPEER